MTNVNKEIIKYVIVNPLVRTRCTSNQENCRSIYLIRVISKRFETIVQKRLKVIFINNMNKFINYNVIIFSSLTQRKIINKYERLILKKGQNEPVKKAFYFLGFICTEI